MEKEIKAKKVAQIDITDEIHIEIGAKVNLEIEEIEAPMSCVFVGHQADKYIAITPPARFESIRNKFFNGRKVNIKYLFRSQILEFQSNVIDISTEPIKLILLDIPEFIQRQDPRLQKRVNCFISAKLEIETKEDEPSIKGVIKDISRGGCRLLIQDSKNAEDLFQKDDNILVKCAFPGIAGEQETLGKIIDVIKNEDEISVRVQFPEVAWWVPPYE